MVLIASWYKTPIILFQESPKQEMERMTVYLIAQVKVNDDAWVPAYAASVHDIVPNTAASTCPGAATRGH